jgi:FixJ family two-component response regulator
VNPEPEALIHVSAMPAPPLDNQRAIKYCRLGANVTDNRIDGQGPVCIVDDDEWVSDSLSALLEAYGFAVRSYGSGADFLADRRRRPAAKFLIIDQHIPGLDGLDVIAELQREGSVLPTILITGRLDGGIAQRAAGLGVLAVLEKPFPAARLIELIHRAVSLRQ